MKRTMRNATSLPAGDQDPCPNSDATRLHLDYPFGHEMSGRRISNCENNKDTFPYSDNTSVLLSIIESEFLYFKARGSTHTWKRCD